MNWIHHKKILQRGYNEFGLAIGMFNNAMLFWLLLRDFFEVRRAFILVLPLFGLVVLGSLYLLGIFYERKMIRQEYVWETERNEPFQKVMKDLEEIKETLGNRTGQSGCGGCRDSGDHACSGVKETDEVLDSVHRPGSEIKAVGGTYPWRDICPLLPSTEGDKEE